MPSAAAKKVVKMPEAPTAPVARLAAEAVMEHNGDGDAAAEALFLKLRTEYRQFYEWKAARAMRDWCFEQIRSGRKNLRQIIIDGPKGRETDPIQPLDSQSLAAVATYYDWPLITGIKLGDGKLADIIATRAKYDGDVVVYERRSKFLRLVAEALPSANVKVRNALSLQQLTALARRAKLAAVEE